MLTFQGMSDLLSPILVTMMDEAHAYICFCSLMQRLRSNFFIDGESMTKKFQHLTDALLYYDPEFFTYLKLNQADDLLFCYRWLLLEMKREFNFDDCFKVLETLWSSLPPSSPSRTNGLQLFELKFAVSETPAASKPTASNSSKVSNSTTATLRKQETAYSKVASLRRQTSGICGSPSNRPFDMKVRRQNSGASNGKEARPARIKSAGSTELDRTGSKKGTRLSSTPIDQDCKAQRLVKSNSWVNTSTKNKPPNHLPQAQSSGKIIKDLRDFSQLTSISDNGPSKDKDNIGTKTKNNECDLNLKCVTSDSDNDTNDSDATPRDQTDDDDVVGYSHFNSASMVKLNGSNSTTNQFITGLTLVCQKLPEPIEFGDGNPFLIFLCIACLLQHRNIIMQQQLDYQEIAMYFDKMVRRHDVEKTLSIARRLFAEYLNGDWSANNNSDSKTDQSPESGPNNKIINDKC